MSFGEKLELHYYLNNGSHSMDALVRNKCEAEILAIIQEISTVLSLPVNIESEAFREGGLKEIWRFVGKHNGQLMFFLGLITIILTRFPVLDDEKEALEKDHIKVSIEEKKLNVEKLKRELNGAEVSKDTKDAVIHELNRSAKITARKSNFYRNLAAYEKVTGVGIVTLNNNYIPITDELFVARSDFNKFLVRGNEIPPETIEDAEIKIISPVLEEDNYKWGGLYKGNPISFSMTDTEFKNAVLRKEISFQRGNVIECVLSIYRKFDEIGNIIITGHSVVTVIKITNGGASLETAQGRRYKERKRSDSNQNELWGCW